MVLKLRHSPGNPRNSEGSLVKLKDDRVVLIYTRFHGGSFQDGAPADLYMRATADGGRSWSAPRLVLKNEAQNVMSVSLLRLQDGRIAMAYLRKTQIKGFPAGQVDCRPLIRFSSDETQSWSAPVDVTGYPPLYLVLSNDRLIQLHSGRLLLPVAYHHLVQTCEHGRGEGLFFLSDDGGATWREARQCVYAPQWLSSGLRDPGAIELSDGRVMAWFRTGDRAQYKAFSADGGETWTPAERAPEFPSHESTLSMKRNPKTGELFALWDDNDPRWGFEPLPGTGKRTPLVLARSNDEGKTWHGHTLIEKNPACGYCYIAMLFDDDKLYLEYCCGDCRECCIIQDSCVRVLELGTSEVRL